MPEIGSKIIKLGLIGKNLSHSLSPQVYRKLRPGFQVDYHLLDYPEYSLIPPLRWILEHYQLNGLSVTAPYKSWARYGVDDFSGQPSEQELVNCLGIKNNRVVGINTDLLAFETLYRKNFANTNHQLLVLGDGAMGKMVCGWFRENKLSFNLHSRRLGNLGLIPYRSARPRLIINTCSRQYLPSFKICEADIFWDFNYRNDLVRDYVCSRKAFYHDGRELLVGQAEHALKFWGL